MSTAARGLPSPCIQVCVLNAEQVCLGCGRHSQEIAAWPTADLGTQADIVMRSQQRLKSLAADQPPETERPKED